jgi:hypothetical protein
MHGCHRALGSGRSTHRQYASHFAIAQEMLARSFRSRSARRSPDCLNFEAFERLIDLVWIEKQQAMSKF